MANLLPPVDSGRSIFVGNLPWDLSEAVLSEMVRAPSMGACRIMRHEDTGRSKGYAIVNYSTAEEAALAIRQFDKMELQGRVLNVRHDRGGKRKRRPSSASPGSVENVGQLHSRDEANENVGHVARGATSFESFEKAARERDAKGVIWERGVHELDADIEAWVSQEPESMESFAREQMLVVAPSSSGHGDDHDLGGCGDVRCGDVACAGDDDGQQVQVAGDKEVQAACIRLVRNLPAAFREAVRADAVALAAVLRRSCPEANWLTMQIEVVAHVNSCKKWHHDYYAGRATVTYNGPGTWVVDDAAVRHDVFENQRGVPYHIANPAMVPCFEDIIVPGPNAAVLIKGNFWPGIQGKGLTHKSPDIRVDAYGNPEMKRLMLKVDVSGKQPGL